MVMGVAFSIQMRVERAGAGNFKHGVMARHMIWSGLANAICDITDSMTLPNNDFYIYPPWEVLASEGDEIEIAGSVNRFPASVISRKALDCITSNMQDVVANAKPHWYFILDDDNLIRGRYAFVVVNTSGLLDVNALGEDDRIHGTNSSEIVIEDCQLPDFGGRPSVAKALLNNKPTKNYWRYETVEEMLKLHSTGVDSLKDAGSLATYSLARVGEYCQTEVQSDDLMKVNPIDMVDISGKPESWNESKIKDALRKAGVWNDAVNMVYANMQDYADPDIKPRLVNGFCAEPIPMVNEFVSEMTMSLAGSTLTVNYTNKSEAAYPFAVDDTNSYSWTVSAEIDLTISSSAPEIKLKHSIPPNVTTITTPSKNTFSTQTIEGIFTKATTNEALTVSGYVNFSSEIKHGATLLERVKRKVPVTVNEGDITINPGDSITATFFIEALDPRFNQCAGVNNYIESFDAISFDEQQQWLNHDDLLSLKDRVPAIGTSSTIGAVNNLLKVLLDSPDNNGMNLPIDRGARFFVANRPFNSVGELGFIADKTLSSLKLFDNNQHDDAKGDKYHKVFDYFRVNAGPYQQGLINLNTTNALVLASAFVSAPQEEFNTNSTVLSWRKACDLASNIVNFNISKTAPPYTNFSDVQLAVKDMDWNTIVSGGDDIERESVFRNSVGLTTTRHNLFTIIIRSDAFSEGVGGRSQVALGTTLASSRALAEVWRDPVPDENGNHKCLIRYFRFLDD